jgi:mannose/cellobiose epimerase-like protein (N-acyl-D-glucosamine 2-epimerase family)
MHINKASNGNRSCRQADKKVEALESHLDNMQQEKLLQQQQNPSSTPNGSNNSPHLVIGHSFVLYLYF